MKTRYPDLALLSRQRRGPEEGFSIGQARVRCLGLFSPARSSGRIFHLAANPSMCVRACCWLSGRKEGMERDDAKKEREKAASDGTERPGWRNTHTLKGACACTQGGMGGNLKQVPNQLALFFLKYLTIY